MIACLLYMAVTWSMCLAFVVSEEPVVAIMFALLNIFQGPLVLPRLVRVIGNNLKKAANPDIELDDIAMLQQTEQSLVKVRAVI